MGSRSTPLSPPSSRTRDPRPRRNMRSCEEIIEGYLKLHGIEPGPNKSFAMTVARALGSELRS
jgi:hypothetical protein